MRLVPIHQDNKELAQIRWFVGVFLAGNKCALHLISVVYSDRQWVYIARGILTMRNGF